MNSDNFSSPNRYPYILKRYGYDTAITFAKTTFEADGIEYDFSSNPTTFTPPLLVTGKVTSIASVSNADLSGGGNISAFSGHVLYYYAQNTQTQGEQPYYPPPVSGNYWRYNGYGGRTVTPGTSGQFLANTDDFTFEFFLQKEGSPLNSMGQFGFGYPTYGSKNWVIRDNGGSPLEFVWTTGDFNTSSLQLCNDNAVFENYQHVAIVRKDGVLKSYLNGTLIDTETGVAAATSFDASYDFKIGAADGSNNYSTANFSNVRYVVGTALYDSDFSVPNLPLQVVNASGTRLLITGFGDVDSSLWGASIDFPPDYSGTTAIVVVDSPYA